MPQHFLDQPLPPTAPGVLQPAPSCLHAAAAARLELPGISLIFPPQGHQFQGRKASAVTPLGTYTQLNLHVSLAQLILLTAQAVWAACPCL